MNKEPKRRLAGYIAAFMVGAGVAWASVPIYYFASSMIFGKQVQTVQSPDRQHEAELIREDNVTNFNLVVKVDGIRVYESPDLYGGSVGQFRETLVWDKSGQVVVLELMGKRVFAYNAADKLSLGKGAIGNYEFYPMPGDFFDVYLKDIDE